MSKVSIEIDKYEGPKQINWEIIHKETGKYWETTIYKG